jgi:hypothetical protein
MSTYSNGHAGPALHLFGSGYELDNELVGDWTREQLEEMDASFAAALERAFDLGLERRGSASAEFRGASQGSAAVALQRARRLEADAQASWQMF